MAGNADESTQSRNGAETPGKEANHRFDSREMTGWRAAEGSRQNFQQRLDLNRARPIHLALVDGVMTMQGGADAWEGPGAISITRRFPFWTVGE